MAGLGVQQHRVDREWIDLPFPPVAASSPGLVGRDTPFQHQTFHAAFACHVAHRCCPLPIVGVNVGRQLDPHIVQRTDDLSEPRTPFLQRQLTQVRAIDFQQVIGEHAHWRVAQGGRTGFAALDAGLQRGEGTRQVGVFVPGQQLAVQHAAIGKRHRGLLDFGKRPSSRSSPRDHNATSPRRRSSCRRMPSHFHSSSQSSIGPSRSAGSPSSGDARKNG